MRISRGLTVAAGLVVVALLTSGCTAASEPASSRSSDPANGADASGSTPSPTGKVTAVWVQAMDDAQVVHASDGKNHVEYNLVVVNAYSDPVTLTRVTATDADGHELGTISGSRLAAATQTLFTHATSASIPASAAVAVEVDLALTSGETVPEHVSNRVEYALPASLPGNVIVDDTVVQGPRVDVDAAKPITIAPPLRGDGWLATSACCSPNVHRDLRLAVDGQSWATAETFAVDWAQVKGDRLYEGTGSANEQFYGFGADVVAVADARVVAVTDGVPESTPFTAGSPDSKEGFGGNQVILKLADGVYAAYAHLQPGSIRVHIGDDVTMGEVIAKLGNSGPSQGPHLHFGLLDRPDLFTGMSLPFVLRSFDLVGTVDLASATGDTLQIAPTSQKAHDAYPLYGTVVDF
ncbi:M23 family metallopeptidase [Humibacter soli]